MAENTMLTTCPRISLRDIVRSGYYFPAVAHIEKNPFSEKTPLPKRAAHDAVHSFRLPRLRHSLRLRRRGGRVEHSRGDLHANPINKTMVRTFVLAWVWGQLRLQGRDLLLKNRI